MFATSYSLTERLIINPVLYLRAEVFGAEKEFKGRKIRQFLESEVLARITALFTSIFAAADFLFHLAVGCGKGSMLFLERRINLHLSWNKADVREHFLRAAYFGVLTLLGSVVAPIYPQFLKKLKSPLRQISSDIPANLPGKIRHLAQSMQEHKEKLPKDILESLRTFWNKSDLSQRHWFVQAFNQNGQQFQLIREGLAKTVYMPWRHKKARWLNEREVSDFVGDAAARTRAFSQAFFFHATSEKALESILKTQRVEVRHEKAYRGAFVSTRPEFSFGPCILAFRKNIERLSHLNIGFSANLNSYWAGFSRDIPVNESTLAYIILVDTKEEARKSLESRCKLWTGRDCSVVLLKDLMPRLQQIESLAMGLPIEWLETTLDAEAAGVNILNAMRLALNSPVNTAASATAQPAANPQIIQPQVHAVQMVVAARPAAVQQPQQQLALAVC